MERRVRHDEIDRTNWTYDIGGWGWGNGEAQYYTDRPENARTQNGLLVIELRDEVVEGNAFTSARLLSQGLREFRYGRIEARLKVPAGAGTWPAFWMLGAQFDEDAPEPERQWPNVGEIDIMEYTGKEPDLILGTVHGPGYSGAGGRSKWFRQEFDIADDWHTYAIDWNEERIQWFFDDEMYYELEPENIKTGEWVFDQPFFLILNLAHGGTLGGLDRSRAPVPDPVPRRLRPRVPADRRRRVTSDAPNPGGPGTIFFDDFSSGDLDRATWNVRTTGTVVNDEVQAYVDSPDTLYVTPVDASTSGGHVLAIHPRHRPNHRTDDGQRFDFVSGRLDTRDRFHFRYGIAAASHEAARRGRVVARVLDDGIRQLARHRRDRRDGVRRRARLDERRRARTRLFG